jgi:hypothetical protein
MKTNKLTAHKKNIDVCFENSTNPGTGWNLWILKQMLHEISHWKLNVQIFTCYIILLLFLYDNFDTLSLQHSFSPPIIFLPRYWLSLSPTRKETSYSDQTLTFASHSKTIQKVVRPTRSPRQQWLPRRTKNGDLSIVFYSGRAKDLSAPLYVRVGVVFSGGVWTNSRHQLTVGCTVSSYSDSYGINRLFYQASVQRV